MPVFFRYNRFSPQTSKFISPHIAKTNQAKLQNWKKQLFMGKNGPKTGIKGKI
jgi:hypothetical protein